MAIQSHADPLVRLLARGFLLVFCSNPSVEMHRFRARDMGQTDRRTDGRIAALLSPREPWPQYGCGYHAIYIVSNCCLGGSVAECLACWTQARKGVGSNRSRDALCSHPLCLCSPSSEIGSSPLKGCEGNCRPGGKYWQPTAGFMTHITCRLTAKNRDQLRIPTLGNRVWANFLN